MIEFIDELAGKVLTESNEKGVEDGKNNNK